MGQFLLGVRCGEDVGGLLGLAADTNVRTTRFFYGELCRLSKIQKVCSRSTSLVKRQRIKVFA